MTSLPSKAAARHALLLRDGQADPDDIMEALAWIEASPENRAAFDQAERFLSACDHALSEPTWLETISSAAAGRDRVHRRVLYALAASIVLAFVGLLAALWLYPRETAGQLPVTQAHYASAIGETRRISLPDGSTMKLASASSVAIAFDGRRRDIFLAKGEALFNVAHDPARPFVVSSTGGSTTAVGTAFNIHRGDEGSTVTVIHGVVDVRSSGLQSRSVSRLAASMQVHYSANGQIGVIRKVDLASALSWEQGRLQFVQAPLALIIEDLNRYSSIPISIDDDRARNIRLSAVIDTSHLEDWLTALARTGRIEMTISDRHIVLRAIRQKEDGQN